MQADVIIVGGGIAAITAALDLLSFGQKVLIIETPQGSKLWRYGAMVVRRYVFCQFAHTKARRYD